MPPPSNRKLTQSERPTKHNALDKNPTNARAMPLKPRKNLTDALETPRLKKGKLTPKELLASSNNNSSNVLSRNLSSAPVRTPHKRKRSPRKMPAKPSAPARNLSNVPATPPERRKSPSAALAMPPPKNRKPMHNETPAPSKRRSNAPVNQPLSPRPKPNVMLALRNNAPNRNSNNRPAKPREPVSPSKTSLRQPFSNRPGNLRKLKKAEKI
jgi:hypothetical protein